MTNNNKNKRPRNYNPLKPRSKRMLLFNYRGKNGAILTPLKVVKELKRKRVEVMNMMEELEETSELPFEDLIKESESLTQDIEVCEKYLAAERQRQKRLRADRRRIGVSEKVKKLLSQLNLQELVSVSEEMSKLMHGLCQDEEDRLLEEGGGLVNNVVEEDVMVAEEEEEKECNAEGSDNDEEELPPNRSVLSRWFSGFM